MNLTMTNRQGKHLFVTQHSVENTPVMVFSNSLGTDQGMWQAQIEALANKYHIITYDTRGHGKSDVIAQTVRKKSESEELPGIIDGHRHHIGRRGIFTQYFQSALRKFFGFSIFASGSFGKNNRRTFVFFDIFRQTFNGRNGLFGIFSVNKYGATVSQIVGNAGNSFP